MDEPLDFDDIVATAGSTEDLWAAVQTFIDTAEADYKQFLDSSLGNEVSTNPKIEELVVMIAKDFRETVQKFQDYKSEIKQNLSPEEIKQLAPAITSYKMMVNIMMLKAVRAAGTSYGYTWGIVTSQSQHS